MAPPESFKVWVFHLTEILAEDGPPTENWKKKNKFVLSDFYAILSVISCFFLLKKAVQVIS